MFVIDWSVQLCIGVLAPVFRALVQLPLSIFIWNGFQLVALPINIPLKLFLGTSLYRLVAHTGAVDYYVVLTAIPVPGCALRVRWHYRTHLWVRVGRVPLHLRRAQCVCQSRVEAVVCTGTQTP